MRHRGGIDDAALRRPSRPRIQRDGAISKRLMYLTEVVPPGPKAGDDGSMGGACGDVVPGRAHDPPLKPATRPGALPPGQLRLHGFGRSGSNTHRQGKASTGRGSYLDRLIDCGLTRALHALEGKGVGRSPTSYDASARAACKRRLVRRRLYREARQIVLKHWPQLPEILHQPVTRILFELLRPSIRPAAHQGRPRFAGPYASAAVWVGRPWPVVRKQSKGARRCGHPIGWSGSQIGSLGGIAVKLPSTPYTAVCDRPDTRNHDTQDDSPVTVRVAVSS
jgi:hypothetical protein